MKFPGRKWGQFVARRKARLMMVGGAVAAAAVLMAAPVIGDGLNRSPEPASPVIAATVPASAAQVAGANLPSTAGISTASVSATKGKKKVRTRVVVKPVTIRSRITTEVISTEENKGSFVGIRCPAGSRAISGGVLSGFINLLMASSSPNNPTTGKYTPNTWWVAVTNTNIDGHGGTLTWKGVVNCISPARIGK